MAIVHHSRPLVVLTAPTFATSLTWRLSAIVLMMLITAQVAPANASDATSDPNFPLIRLPSEFDSRRSTHRVDLNGGASYDLIDVQGPGCVRHFWVTSNVPEHLQIEITCDDADEPQVRMTLHQFFGVLLGQKPYRIESAPIKLLPKSGFNSYFPIPFESRCRIVLRNMSKHDAAVWSMANWHKYDQGALPTPLRLHAVYTQQKKAEPLGSTLLGSIEGKGFVAGLFHAIRRHDMRDMIWHTGGDTWLIDGETNPHVLRGIGSEDMFGHSFGLYKDASQWTGGVHAVGEGKDTSQIVGYRFFGVDPVAFKSSLVLRFGTRANDYESVLFYYKDRSVAPSEVRSPQRWVLTGPSYLQDFAAFAKVDLPDDVAAGKDLKWNWANRTLSPVTMTPEHTWVDFARWFRKNKHGNTGTQPHRCAAYATTTIQSKQSSKAVLRLGFDDWARVWLNGKAIATLRHDNGFKTADVPVDLRPGENQLVIRLSNADNIEWRSWAFSCVIRNGDE